jgi:hypothetical protein
MENDERSYLIYLVNQPRKPSTHQRSPIRQVAVPKAGKAIGEISVSRIITLKRVRVRRKRKRGQRRRFIIVEDTKIDF